MATRSRKTPARTSPGRKTAPRRPNELDELNHPGNLDPGMIEEGVRVQLGSDGIGLLTPVAFDRLSPEERQLGAELMRLVGQRRLLAREIDALVGHMRSHRVSWGVIGWCVGTSSEAARQRWGVDS